MSESDDRPIHSFFGLSYASYLVLPRSVMQAMPAAWQRQMVNLLERVQEKYGHLYSNHLYDVKLVEDSDQETGEAIRYGTDPLADYRHPVVELREKSVGERVIEGLTELNNAIEEDRLVFEVWVKNDGGEWEWDCDYPWPSAEADKLKSHIDRLHSNQNCGEPTSRVAYKVVTRE